MCPACWDLRSKTVSDVVEKESKRLQIGGLIIGFISLLHPLIQVGSLIINIRELIRGTGGRLRWMNIVGLIVTVLAMLTWIIGIVWAANHS